MKTLLFTICSWAFAALLFAKLHSGGLMTGDKNLILVVFGLVMVPLVVSGIRGRHHGGGSSGGSSGGSGSGWGSDDDCGGCGGCGGDE